MAKSTKSKWKSKMHNIKREKYAKKELEKLKKMAEEAKKDREMHDALFKEASKMETNEDNNGEQMEVDGKKRNPKTLRDENGHYPAWMNSRRIRKHKHALKSKKGKSKKW